MRNCTIVLALFAALALVVGTSAQAAVINIDIDKDGEVFTCSLPSGLVSDTGTVWNSVLYGTAYTNSPLVDSTGATTPVTWTKPGGLGGWRNTTDVSFLPNLRADSCHAAATWTLSGLPADENYTIYMMGGGHRYGSTGKWTFDGAYLQSGTTTTFTADGPNQSSWVEFDNYVSVGAKSDATGDLVFTTNSGNNFVGLQIEGDLGGSAGGAIPEPSTFAIWALGLLGLALYARRRRS